jgi:hypothetical protein
MEAMLGEFWTLLPVLVVVGMLVLGGTRQRRAAQAQSNAREAARRGMAYDEPGASSHQDAESVVDESTHRYSGSTRGVGWVLEAHSLAQQDIIGDRHPGEGQRSFTRWTAPAAGTSAAGGGVLLLMNLQGRAQGAVPEPSPPGVGLMAALLDKAAGVALQTYARMAYGSARAQGLVWGQASGQIRHLPLPAGEFATAFRAFGSRPELLQRVGAQAREWLLRTHHRELALLWGAHGLTLRWPSARITPDEVAACAEWGAALVGLLQDPEAPAPGGEAPRP